MLYVIMQMLLLIIIILKPFTFAFEYSANAGFIYFTPFLTCQE